MIGNIGGRPGREEVDTVKAELFIRNN